jgi:hypothetical protein
LAQSSCSPDAGSAVAFDDALLNQLAKQFLDVFEPLI